MKIKLFLTFDHELPLGNLKSSYDDALFLPSERVMDVAERLGVKVVFFTDILCALRFKEWDYENFYLPYLSQVETILRRGHDVQLHIHPHWLTSDFRNGKFIPSEDFSLSDFADNVQVGGISGVIITSVSALTDICRKIKPDYRCWAFRAGGYNIQPKTEEIFKTLYSIGIRYDSSIARGYYFKSSVSKVDFTHLPWQGNWVVDPQNISLINSGEGLIEVPIVSIPKKIFEIPTVFKMRRLRSRIPLSHGDVIHGPGAVSYIDKLRMMICDRMVSFDNYTLSSDYMIKALEYNLNKFGGGDELLLSIIAHPKSMGDYSYRLMQEFVDKVRLRFDDVEFLTFSGLENELIC
ncbi:MAG: hypothetical protein RIS29_517 [Bacteroidota bacterium]|jgi:hypothetical protein